MKNFYFPFQSPSRGVCLFCLTPFPHFSQPRIISATKTTLPISFCNCVATPLLVSYVANDEACQQFLTTIIQMKEKPPRAVSPIYVYAIFYVGERPPSCSPVARLSNPPPWTRRSSWFGRCVFFPRMISRRIKGLSNQHFNG